LLLDIIYQVGKTIGIEYNVRNSFGFRNITTEYYKIINSNTYLFKIAPGLIRGVKYYFFLETMNVLSELNLEEFRSLRKLYLENNWAGSYKYV